jgi:hypothetical protein
MTPQGQLALALKTATLMGVGALAAPHAPRHGSPPTNKTISRLQYTSFRFLDEAMIGRSSRFLGEATGDSQHKGALASLR